MLAAVVVFSVLAGPHSDSSWTRAARASQLSGTVTTQPSVEDLADSLYSTCKTDAGSAVPCSDCNPLCPAKDLLDTIAAHYGQEGGSKKDPELTGKTRTAEKSKGDKQAAEPYNFAEHWNVPEGENQRILFVIATAPDPVHTHMSLAFDRTIEAIQKAAQESGYLFSRATMPWQVDEHPDSPDLKLRLAQEVYYGQKETYPGLMIFRKATQAKEESRTEDISAENNDGVAQANALFVLVVGETPTGGIHKDQYRNALRIILDIRAKFQVVCAIFESPAQLSPARSLRSSNY